MISYLPKALFAQYRYIIDPDCEEKTMIQQRENHEPANIRIIRTVEGNQ